MSQLDNAKAWFFKYVRKTIKTASPDSWTQSESAVFAAARKAATIRTEAIIKDRLTGNDSVTEVELVNFRMETLGRLRRELGIEREREDIQGVQEWYWWWPVPNDFWSDEELRKMGALVE